MVTHKGEKRGPHIDCRCTVETVSRCVCVCLCLHVSTACVTPQQWKSFCLLATSVSSEELALFTTKYLHLSS